MVPDTTSREGTPERQKNANREQRQASFCASRNNNVSATPDFFQPCTSVAPLNLSDIANLVL
jgi:hypothetical protein